MALSGQNKPQPCKWRGRKGKSFQPLALPLGFLQVLQGPEGKGAFSDSPQSAHSLE